MKLSEAQKRMLLTLKNGGDYGVPIGLSDLSNLAFTKLMKDGFVSSAWVDRGSIVAWITEAGRAILRAQDTK